MKVLESIDTKITDYEERLASLREARSAIAKALSIEIEKPRRKTSTRRTKNTEVVSNGETITGALRRLLKRGPHTSGSLHTSLSRKHELSKHTIPNTLQALKKKAEVKRNADGEWELL